MNTESGKGEDMLSNSIILTNEQAQKWMYNILTIFQLNCKASLADSGG